MKAIWSGSIGFGLIHIPIKLYSAVKERVLSFRLVDKHDLCPISYTKVCRADNRPIDQKNIVKGYEYEKGKYVTLEEDDFRRADAKRTSIIDIQSFTSETEIDISYIEKPYYLEPDKKAHKAYVLLRDAMREAKKVGIAKFALKDREYVGVVRVKNGMLELLELRFKEEFHDVKSLKIPKTAAYSKKELQLAVALVDHLTEPFDHSEYTDTYTEKLLEVIKEKVSGVSPKSKLAGSVQKTTELSDILAMLKRSLEERGVH